MRENSSKRTLHANWSLRVGTEFISRWRSPESEFFLEQMTMI